MKQSIFLKKIISSIFITATLLYFMANTPSPKIIFVPFLICSLSMAGQNIALLLNKEKIAIAFHKLFAAGFFLFWFGFLAIAAYLCIRDKNYSLLVFSIPFWVVGVCFAKNRLFRGKPKKKRKTKKVAESKFAFPIIMSAILVAIVLLAGVIVLILGIKDGNAGLIFAGAFFVFGAFTFVLAALMLQGYFDKVKVDVLGIYMGAVIAAVGIGSIALKYGETHSLEKTIEEFGLWIIIPILMIAVGVIEVVKCLKNKKT